MEHILSLLHRTTYIQIHVNLQRLYVLLTMTLNHKISHDQGVQYTYEYSSHILSIWKMQENRPFVLSTI